MSWQDREKLATKARELYTQGAREVILVLENDEKIKRRIGEANGGGIIIMDRRSRRWGNKVEHYSNLKDILPIISNTTPQQKWAKQIRNIILTLEKSGLWPELLKNFKLAEQIGYDKLKLAYDASWAEPREERIEKVRAVDPRLIEKNENGEEYYNTEILWYMINLKVKKMNFGEPGLNEVKLAEIKSAMDKKEKLNMTGDNGYDVTFEYNPEQNKAWYSEEYRGCGNGHYYLTLDATHAMFYEDD